MLMMPDLFGWLLTGRRAGERTDASTTQLLDPRSGTWSDELCRDLGLPRAILPELIEPGTELGPMRRSVAEEVGLARPVTVIAPATHDTASAVAAVPADRRHRVASASSLIVAIGAAGLVLPQLGDLVAPGRRSSAAGDQRRNDEV